MVKKLFGIFVAFSLLLTLTACGSDSETTGSKSDDASKETSNLKGVVAPEDFDKMYSDPASYKGYEVEFTGKVFVDPEKDADGTYLQVYAKPDIYEQNVLVAYPDPDFQVALDDYVKIKGIVRDEYEGENLMGGTIVAPIIDATSIEVVDYITAVSPTIKTIEVNEEINQSGYIVTLQKIEWAENQTRVYVKVNNQTNDPISFWSHAAYLIVGNKQLDSEYLPEETGLSEVQSEILPGVESEGVIVFPAIDPDTPALSFHADGSSDNWEINIEPFVFDVTVN